MQQLQMANKWLQDSPFTFPILAVTAAAWFFSNVLAINAIMSGPHYFPVPGGWGMAVFLLLATLTTILGYAFIKTIPFNASNSGLAPLEDVQMPLAKKVGAMFYLGLGKLVLLMAITLLIVGLMAFMKEGNLSLAVYGLGWLIVGFPSARFVRKL